MVDAHPELMARPDAVACMAVAARAGVALTLPKATGVAKALGRLQPVEADAAYRDSAAGPTLAIQTNSVDGSADHASGRQAAFAALLRKLA
jgi:hypothetical protein